MKHETPESLDLLNFGYERGLQERAAMSLLAYFAWGYFTLAIAAAAYAIGRHARLENWNWPWAPRDSDHRRAPPFASAREGARYAFSRPPASEEEIRIAPPPSRVSVASRDPSEGDPVANGGIRVESAEDALLSYEMQPRLRPRIGSASANSP